MDISPEMLDVARAKKHVYQNLRVVDMTRAPLPYGTAFYDACLCVGTFTHGHVPPHPALRELIRIVRHTGGIQYLYRDSLQFGTTMDKLRDEGLCQIMEISKIPYILTKGYHSYTVVLQTL